MYQLKKIDLPTVALFSFLLFFIIALIFISPIVLLMTMIGEAMPEVAGTEFDFIPFFSGIFLLIIPLFYAVLATIINVIIVLCYNFFAQRFGGIKIDLHKVGELEKIG